MSIRPRFFSALGLSALLHCGLLLPLVLCSEPASPPAAEAYGDIEISLVSLSAGGWASVAEDKSVPADRRSSAMPVSRPPAAQAGKMPKSGLKTDAKKSAPVAAEAGARAPSAFGPDAAGSEQDGGGRELSAAPSAVSGAGGASGNGPSGLSANRKPVYPELARRRGQEGLVVLLAEVDAGGAATSVSVQHSSGHRLLDEAAVSAVRRWRFKPARYAGADVAGRVRVPVEFRLHP